MYRMMLQRLAGEAKAPALRSALSAGEILDPATAAAWEERIGLPLRNSVGMTPIRHLFLESNRDGEKVAPGTSVGAPLAGYEARLVDTDGELIHEPGESGRLALHGPSGITYWINANPSLVDRAAQDVRGGWSFLDDAYMRDEQGWLWFGGRLDDMIVTAGRQVAPMEVEQVIGGHPDVAEVAVVPAPDPVRGQAVCAFVRLRDPDVVQDEFVERIQEYAKANMAAYKYPRRVEFVAELPKDQVGKIQRRVLREQLAAQSVQDGP